MKRPVAILLLLLYLTPTLGVTLSWSRCNNKQMLASTTHKCVCKAKKDSKCCSSKKFTVKFKDSQQKSEVLLQQFHSDLAFHYIFAGTTVAFSDLLPAVEKVRFKLPRPPNISKPCLYLLHGVFRI